MPGRGWDKILNKLPKEVPSVQEAENSAAAALKKILQEARYGSADGTPKGRRKKLDIQPGKSIAIEDITPQKPDDLNNNKPGPSKPKKQKPRKKKLVSSESETEEEEDWNQFVKRKRVFTRRFSDSGSEEDESVLRENESDNNVDTIDIDGTTSDEEIQNTKDENGKTEENKKTEQYEYHKNDFVLVELKSTKNISKKFLAKIVSIENDSFVCSYLRSHSKIKEAYIFPQSDLDFSQLHKEKSYNLLKKWDSFKTLIPILNSRIKDKQNISLLKLVNTLSSGETSSNVIIALLLHALLPPTVEHTVKSENKKLIVKSTIKDSQDSFFFHIKGEDPYPIMDDNAGGGKRDNPGN
ncbi:unnamed protein product [Ceutorhynchus assimilis]|uniref:Uncharacterized protein n=1 Tax=Ceutorhynchus assimilis TaxID=467358 RepID=A0A9N9MLW0_9CUCU|nr:unnamed protein product [Ceutorhynchus assimilis]